MNKIKDIINNDISSGKSYGFIKKYFSDEIIKEYQENINLAIGAEYGRVNIKNNDISNKFLLFLNECKNTFLHDEYEFYFLEGQSSGLAGTKLHYDPYPIIHLQLTGKTQWNIGVNALEKGHLWDNEKGAWNWEAEWINTPDSFLLEPGDIIWFKNWIWHETKNKEDKISLVFEAGKNGTEEIAKEVYGTGNYGSTK